MSNQPTPPWATVADQPCVTADCTVADQPCVTADCTDCGEPYGGPDIGPDIGGHWHFASAEKIAADVADAAKDYDPGETPWVIVGDALLCQRCAATRTCLTEGHQWVHHESFTTPYPPHKTVPEYWSCARDCTTGFSRTDPNKPDLTVAGGDRS